MALGWFGVSVCLLAVACVLRLCSLTSYICVLWKGYVGGVPLAVVLWRILRCGVMAAGWFGLVWFGDWVWFGPVV